MSKRFGNLVSIKYPVWLIYFVLLVVFSSQAFALKNAMHQVNPLALADRITGVNARINYTGPNLNGGQWSYHRVAVVETGTFYYVEFGYWYHHIYGYQAFWVVNNSLGFSDGDIGTFITPTTHQFRIINQWYSLNWTIQVDGVSYYTLFQDFSYGDQNIAGGEVCDGDCPTLVDEHMGNTKYNNLKWRECLSNCNASTATYQWVLWDSSIPYAINPPFTVTVNSNTSFNVNP